MKIVPTIAELRTELRAADVACFGGLSPYEVLAGGRKVVGLSQTRRRQGTLGPQPGGVLGQRLDQRPHCGDLRLHIDAQAEFTGGAGRDGANTGDDRLGRD